MPTTTRPSYVVSRVDGRWVVTSADGSLATLDTDYAPVACKIAEQRLLRARPESWHNDGEDRWVAQWPQGTITGPELAAELCATHPEISYERERLIGPDAEAIAGAHVWASAILGGRALVVAGECD